MDEKPADEANAEEPSHGVKINLSAALGEAGHEVEELGLEDTPDSGDVVTHSGGDKHQTPDEADAFTAGFPISIKADGDDDLEA